jgi:hypothetical protein
MLNILTLEILTIICDYLDINSLLNMISTNKFYYNNIYIKILKCSKNIDDNILKKNMFKNLECIDTNNNFNKLNLNKLNKIKTIILDVVSKINYRYFNKCYNLITLVCGYNYKNGKYFGYLKNFKNLERLYLLCNCSKLKDEDIEKCINIKKLCINKSKITTLEKLNKLEELEITFNTIDINKCVNLKKLTLKWTSDYTIENLPNLTELDISSNLNTIIKNCNNIKKLNISNTNFINLNMFKHLTELHIEGYVNIPDDGLLYCTSIEYLNINFSTKNFNLNNLCKLKKLDAMISNITDKSIVNCTNIESLNINLNHQITTIGHLHKLKHLKIDAKSQINNDIKSQNIINKLHTYKICNDFFN